MRKMMNKKGFSLVELMIVVVIMGILIAVAIPLYGAITDNANNKTCASNIKTIKSNAANYRASYNESVQSLNDIATMFDDKVMPNCPLGDDAYVVGIDTNGSATVECPYVGTTGNDFHTAEKTGSADVTTGIPATRS